MSRSSSTRWLAVGFALFIALAALSAEPPIALHLSAHVISADTSVQVRITIPQSPSNRGVCLQWDSENYGGRSCWPLEGARAPRTHDTMLRALPEGSYEVRAVLMTTQGVKATPVQTIESY